MKWIVMFTESLAEKKWIIYLKYQWLVLYVYRMGFNEITNIERIQELNNILDSENLKSVFLDD